MKKLRPGADNRNLDAGFTLVELIAVLVIAGILAAFALPQFFNKSSYDVSGYFNQAQSIVRFGQTVAIAQGTNVYVRLNGASVALCYDSACASPVVAASGSNSGNAATLAACGNNKTWACEASGAGVTYTATPYTMFFYSPQGKPYLVGDSEPASNFNSLLTITLSSGGSAPLSFYVEQETGYVHH